MYQDKSIELKLSNKNTFICSKGEIVYFKHDEPSKELFRHLIYPELYKGELLNVGDKTLKEINENLEAYRLNLAYISDKHPLLINDLSVSDNIMLYAKSNKSLKYRDQSTQLKAQGLQKQNLIEELSLMQRFHLKWLICMIKSPQFLILENPHLQISPSQFEAFMLKLQQHTIRSKMTTLISLENIELVEKFPGRIVNLTP